MTILAQFIDLDNSQRSEPFALQKENMPETLNMLEDYLKQEVERSRTNIGVLVVMETDENNEKQVSKAPIMKFEQFKKVMEAKYNV